MAKVYLEPTDTAFTVNNNNTTVYGANGNQEITVAFGVTGLSADQNIEKIIFSKMSSEYTYKQAGNQIQLYFNGTLVMAIPVQGDSDGTELIFANGSANAVLTDGVMTIGKASSYTTIDATTGGFDSNLVIPTPTPAPEPSPSPSPSPAPSPAPDTTPPTLTSSTPADDAIAVAVGANIVLTMSEAVTAVATKNITIKKTSDDSIITTIDAADAQVTGSGTSTITINPTADLGASTEYYVLIDSGAFKDGANNNYAGISSITALSFTTEAAADATPPTLTSSTPADNATSVAVGANIVLTMSENVTAVTGKNITIKKTSDDSTITTIDATDAQVTGSSTSTITINPTADLGASTEYYVLIDSGAFKDTANNDYAGISSTSALSFTTADEPPTLTSSSPADNATNIATNANIVLTMSENVTAVTGKNITIKKTSDDSTVTEIDAADAQITGSGTSTITINPTADLAIGTEYYVLIDSGAFKDAANNDYTGISSATALSFKTDPIVYLSKVATGAGGFAINGEAANDQSGISVSFAGDVNKDGLADLIVGAQGNSSSTGRSYIIFGKNSDTNAVNLSTIAAGTGGFAINGEALDDKSGWSVSSAGDVNGDGRADLIVGAQYNDTGGGDAGRSYVVFGKSGTAAVSLATIAAGTGGFAISGEAASDYSGGAVSSAGDINGDGLADLIVAAIGNGAVAGRSYVVFGKSNGAVVSLATIAGGTGGFAISGEAAGDFSGWSVSSAGDVNGDGLADLIVGAKGNDTGGANAGRSYVVFGKSDGAAVSLSTIAAGTGGFAINGQAAGDNNGRSVSSAGDINGDGLGDLIVGAEQNDTGFSNAGRSYVIFGKSDGAAVSLATIAAGTGGFAINGEAANDESGWSVSSAGDVNGDGLTDLIVGAKANDTGASNAGRSYVVFGKNSDTNAVSLSTIAAGTGGFAINGEAANDESGASVSSAGDVNGDGLADLIVGAKGNSSNAGKSYVIFGGTQWLTSSISATGAVNGTASGEALIGSSSSDTLTGGGGIDRFYSGDSNDVILLTSSDITNLADNATGSPKSVINGGGDTDTIRLTAGANLDLTTIANQGASGVEENSRIESIEKIDMSTDTGANTLTLTVNDVIDMSGMNLFNTTNGWTNGSYTLGASVSKHQIIVDGDATDSLIINAGNGVWANGGDVTSGGNTYNVYNNLASNAQILVLSGVGVTNNDAV